MMLMMMMMPNEDHVSAVVVTVLLMAAGILLELDLFHAGMGSHKRPGVHKQEEARGDTKFVFA